MFYEFSQNNSGGWFDTDYGHSVFIEADNHEEANKRALDAGLYFDGCDKGMDCECCGDRWYEQWDDDHNATEVPSAWISSWSAPEGVEEGHTEDLQLAANCDSFFEKGETVYSIYYKDGRVERIKRTE